MNYRSANLSEGTCFENPFWEIAAYRDGDQLVCKCTCPAGQMNRHCIHWIGPIEGVSIYTSPEEMAAIRDLAKGSDYFEYRKAKRLEAITRIRESQNIPSGTPVRTLSMKHCLENAQMVVPKLAFEDENGWHIHWPFHLSSVTHAFSEEELVINLAEHLQLINAVYHQ